MKAVACYLLWAIPLLLIIGFSAALVEALWNIKIHDYVLYLLCITAVVALHYFKFRDS